jgi:prepilin-type N-terminal cleavage/methylation domain-containing protein
LHCHQDVRKDRGFTLIEVLIALGIVSSIVAGVAVLFGVAIKASQGARVQAATVALAVQKLEELRALTWSVDAAGTRITDVTTDLSTSPPTTGGNGLAASPSGTIDANTAGYVDYLDKDGRWVGTGSRPPPQAVFIRRWNIDPLAAAPDDVLVLQVLVTTVVRDASWSGGTRPRLSDDALMVTLKTRRSW